MYVAFRLQSFDTWQTTVHSFEHLVCFILLLMNYSVNYAIN